MKISVIIAVYNDIELDQCLDSVFKSKNIEFEVIVVDDGSTRVDIKEIVNKYSQCRHFAFGENEGPAVARNYGVKKATGEIVFFLDSDAQIYPDTLERIMRHFEDDSELDGVTIIYSDQPVKENYFNKFKAIELNYNFKNFFDKVFGTNGSAIYKEAFFDIGGFDENFKTANAEDFYFGRKVFNKGYKIILDKGISLKNSYVDRFLFQGLIKYCRRAFLRVLVLYQLKDKTETSYDTKKFKLLYLCSISIFILFVLGSVFRPFLWLALLLFSVFSIYNRKLYLIFYKKYGFLFFVRSVFTHYFYILIITFSGTAGLIYALLFRKKNSL